MTEQQLQELEPALDDWLDAFSPCFVDGRTFGHLGTYARGLLSDLPRKTAEPIALASGTPVRTLQEFLKDHVWDHSRLRDLLQGRVAQDFRAHDDGLGLVGIIDETSVAKQGAKTPGVQRQYLGCLGKVANGIVTVHLGLACGGAKALIDADLFLPESWSGDRKRCRAAGIPDTVVHRPKWRIALEQLDRAGANGAKPAWLTFDEGYGCCPAFLAALEERGQAYVGEVPRSLSCLAVVRSGRRPGEQAKGRPAEDVVRCSSFFLSQPWRIVRLARETEQDQAWRVKEALVWTHGADGWSARTRRLVWACSEETGEEKFFLSDAPPEVPLETVLRVAFKRWSVEHCFRACKSELGFAHFEGRNHQALARHMTACLLAMAFAAGQAQRLRGGKPGDDDGEGVPGAGVAERRTVRGEARDGAEGAPAVGAGVPAEAGRGSPPVEEEKAGRRARTQEAAPSTATTSSRKTADREIQVAL